MLPILAVLEAQQLLSAADAAVCEKECPQGGAALLRHLTATGRLAEARVLEALGKASGLEVLRLGDLYALRKHAGPGFQSMRRDRAVWMERAGQRARIAIDDPTDEARLARVRALVPGDVAVEFVLARTSEVDAYFNPPVPEVAPCVAPSDWPDLLATALTPPVRRTAAQGWARLEGAACTVEVQGVRVRGPGLELRLDQGQSWAAGRRVAAAVAELARRLATRSVGARPLTDSAQALLERASEEVDLDGPRSFPSAWPSGTELVRGGAPSLAQQLAGACDTLQMMPALGGWRRDEAHVVLDGTVLTLARLVEGYLDNHRRGTLRVVHGALDLEGLAPAEVRPLLKAWLEAASQLGERPRQRCRYCGDPREDLTLGACTTCAQLFDGTVY